MPSAFTVEVWRNEERIWHSELAVTTTLGRASSNTIVLADDTSISRYHAAIRRFNGQDYQLVDYGSRNGTYINGKRVTMPQTLVNGDEIQIGSFTLRVSAPESAGSVAGFMSDMTQAVTCFAAQTSVDPVAMLICDIRQFSTHAESMEPDQLAGFIGSWFRSAAALIANRSGIVDKFIGDAIFAYWPSSVGNASHESALLAARELFESCAEHRWPDDQSQVEIRIGLHAGSVCFDNIGVSAHRDATIIGDAVNVLFRLEEVMRTQQRGFLASETFTAGLKEEIPMEDLGMVQVKGRRQAIRVFSLGTPEALEIGST